ncbi:hypothetical protein ASwh1_109 [Aeromonas phage Aswh_1]|nr:hypothetical protein ASwh1_109 [Aeromonas phage Aswh_1]
MIKEFTDPVFENFCKTTSVYPPSVMVGPTTKQKEELRWISACETVYSFSNPLLSELRQSYKDMMVCSLFMKNIKYPYLAGVMGVFGAYLEFSFKYLKTQLSKDQDLKKYFSEAYSEIEEHHRSMFNVMQKSLGTEQNCIDSYKEKYDNTIRNLKQRYK